MLSLVSNNLSLHPDAELIALGAQFDEIRTAYFRNTARTDEFIDNVSAETSNITFRAAELPAKTSAGWLIKARLAEWETECLDINHAFKSAEYSKDKILWSIVRDLINLHGGPTDAADQMSTSPKVAAA
jgi:hypothetical protein